MVNGRQTQFFQMEDNLNILLNGRGPPQTNLNGRRPKCFPNRRQPPKKMLQPKTIKSPNNCCGTAPGNLVSWP